MNPFKTSVAFWTYLFTLGFSSGGLAEKKEESSRESAEHVLCKDYLDMKGGPLEARSNVIELARPFLSGLRNALPRTPMKSWPSTEISPQTIVSPKRFTEIVAQIKVPNSQLNRELSNHLKELGGMDSPNLWDAYLVSYDKIATFSEHLLRIAVSAHDILPKDGLIFDVGAGTGTISSVLLMLARERRVIAGDWSAKGLALAKTKLDLVTNKDPSRYKTLLMDLTKEEGWPNPTQKFDGAVMNNVLYAISSKEAKLAVLKRIFNSLKPGAPFVLSDILNLSLPELQTGLAGTAASAVANGAPATEYDIALAGKVNFDVLVKYSSLFMSTEELKALVREAGFKINGWYSSYNGTATFLYMTKPK